jgi:hypothetical protein
MAAWPSFGSYIDKERALLGEAVNVIVLDHRRGPFWRG